jgi:protein-disulfide isomerase
MFLPSALRQARTWSTRRALPTLASALLAGLAACGGASGEERAAGSATPSAEAATPSATVPDAVPASATAAAEAAIRGTMPADSLALRAAADSGRILGAEGAKVWMLMVSDFECPYCKSWHDQSFAALRKEYVDNGKVRMAYMNFPLDQHEQAVPAAEAAMCASVQKKFWEYQSALFGTIERWGKPGDQTAVYESLATAQGLDLARFRSCMRSHVMRAVIEGDRVRMQQAGVQSTPSFFVGSQAIAGAQPTAVFRQALDAALAGAPAAR